MIDKAQVHVHTDTDGATIVVESGGSRLALDSAAASELVWAVAVELAAINPHAVRRIREDLQSVIWKADPAEKPGPSGPQGPPHTHHRRSIGQSKRKEYELGSLVNNRRRLRLSDSPRSASERRCAPVRDEVDDPAVTPHPGGALRGDGVKARVMSCGDAARRCPSVGPPRPRRCGRCGPRARCGSRPALSDSRPSTGP